MATRQNNNSNPQTPANANPQTPAPRPKTVAEMIAEAHAAGARQYNDLMKNDLATHKYVKRGTATLMEGQNRLGTNINKGFTTAEENADRRHTEAEQNANERHNQEMRAIREVGFNTTPAWKLGFGLFMAIVFVVAIVVLSLVGLAIWQVVIGSIALTALAGSIVALFTIVFS